MDHYQDLGLVFPGGNAPNVAVHAARSGATAAFLGVVGDDRAGALFRRSLESEGVDTSRLRTASGPTPVVTVRHNDGTGFDCVACPRYFPPFAPDPEDEDYLAGFDLVHLAGTSRADERAAAWARRRRLSYDFAAGPGEGDALLPLVAYAMVSRPGITDFEAARLAAGLQYRGPQMVAVTRGPAGATACLRGEVRHHPAAAASTIDTLGAGDAFLAHLVVRLLWGDDLDPALGAAARYAAGVCNHLGGFGRGRPVAEILGAT